MVEKSKKNLVFAFAILLITIWLILFRSVWDLDFVARLLLVGEIVLIIWALLKKEKYKLNLIVAFIILLITIWLIRARMVWDFVGQLLLLGVAVLIVRTLLLREKKQAKLLEFFLKSLAVSYIATSIIWFVWLSITSPSFYVDLNFEHLMNTLVLVVLPLSLFPVAISVIIYGTFRIKLRAWEIFLSSWYVSFALIIIWSALQPRPPPGEFYYSSIASAIGELLGLVFRSLLIAGILTIVYVTLKKPKSEPPP